MKEIIQEYPQNEYSNNSVIMYNNNNLRNSKNRFTINSKHSSIEFMKK